MSYWLQEWTAVQDVSGTAGVIGKCYADTEADIGSRSAFTGKTLLATSTCHAIAEGSDWEMDSSGTWHKQPDPHTTQLDLSGYYTSAESDERYARIGTGTSVANGTNLDTLKTIGKYRNSNASNGCTNMPSEVSGRPFTLLVENTYSPNRVRQTMWMGQQAFTGVFYWRMMYNDTTFSGWYKVEGTPV